MPMLARVPITMHRDFHAAGYRVFGLHEIIPPTEPGGAPRCGCGQDHELKLVGKHPRVSSWQHTPQWSADQIEIMEETGQFATGYGVVCRGLLVVDVDERNGGALSLQKLVDQIPKVAQAGLVVMTGSGGASRHYYFKVPEGLALVQTHNDFPGLDFKSSGYVCGPESLHVSGNLYHVMHGSVDDIDDAPPELLALLKKPDRVRADLGNGQTMDVSEKDITEMLKHVRNADLDYEVWIRIGMSIHHATGGTREGYDLWDKWSATSSKYDPALMGRKWHSFGKSANPVTLGTLIHYAEQGGWVQPVTFWPDEVPITKDEIPPLGELIKDLDLSRPPGFVGDVARWIESQCRYRLDIASVGAAIAAVGNIIGLRYTDDKDNVSSNIFAFCIVGSGLGKESLQQAVADCHHAAGLVGAGHGSIKSEQEIIRNLTRHQASFYILDEVGFMLNKIKNAQARGGASYLEAIPGTLMSAYGKANGWFPVSGDFRTDEQARLTKEITQLEKHLDDGKNDAIEAKIASIKYVLHNLERGIERPFVSLIGFSTDVNFETLMDYDSAKNGWLGRALIFYEPDTTPPKKKNFRKPDMPEKLAETLRQLGLAGEFDLTRDAPGARIEYYKPKAIIESTPRALELLDEIDDALQSMAQDEKGDSGLEPLVQRAYEQIAKLSLILAAPGRLRTEQDVLWAYAFVLRDLKTKIKLVVANDKQREKEDGVGTLRAKIESILAGSQRGETVAVIANRLKGRRKDDVERCLDVMVQTGRLETVETTHPYNKSVVRKFRLR